MQFPLDEICNVFDSVSNKKPRVVRNPQLSWFTGSVQDGFVFGPEFRYNGCHFEIAGVVRSRENDRTAREAFIVDRINVKLGRIREINVRQRTFLDVGHWSIGHYSWPIAPEFVGKTKKVNVLTDYDSARRCG